jgi:hypothetical protein
MAEADHEIFEIAEMVVNLGREDAGIAERTIQGLGPLVAGLIPQTGADQDQERQYGRRHQSQQLRPNPQRFQHPIAPINHGCGSRLDRSRVEARLVAPRYDRSMGRRFSPRHCFSGFLRQV